MVNEIGTITELQSGEFSAVKIFEVTNIPTATNLKEIYNTTEEIEETYRKLFMSIFIEVNQVYKNCIKENSLTEISIESLWITEKVSNQTFKAKIRLFWIIRSIENSNLTVLDSVNRIYNLVKTKILSFNYQIKDVKIDKIMELWRGVDTETVRAIVKDEGFENLHNPYFPECYTFDIFDASTRDFSGLISNLILYPNCAVSIQLIPTIYSDAEKNAITIIGQHLNQLSTGINSPGEGIVSFLTANSIASKYRYYHENKDSALFEYSILIYGSEKDSESIASTYYSFTNHDDGSPTSLKNIKFEESEINVIDNFSTLPWIVINLLKNYDRTLKDFNTIFSSFYRIPYVITAEEASLFFRLPIGSNKVSAGLPIDNFNVASKNFRNNIINSGDIAIGSLKSSPKDIIGISLNDLAKHMLVVGTPGSGKTTFSVSLLDRLWKEHNIPFLVIEPAKNEYRALVQGIPNLQVFTPGKNTISPFVYNPFIPPKNVKLETYKSTLKTAFAAGVSMSTPLDKIFEESINNCYSDFMWLDSYTTEDKGKIFNISDFIKCFQKTFDSIGYTGDAKNIGRAGVVRLKSLVNLFDNYFSIPIEDLLSKPTIIELAAIENSDQKSLIISLLLLSILAFVNSNYLGEGNLRNVILLEEAHVLLDADVNAREGEANPSLIAQKLIKRMLAEIRSYGVGLIIADQSPRKVSLDVVALTDIKMVFRLVESMDKQIVSDSMNMSESQEKQLARLKPGEAFLFFNSLDEPEEIVTEDYRNDKNISITISDKHLKESSIYWKGKEKFLKPYTECSLINSCNDGCEYECRLLGREIARRIFNKNFNPNDNNFKPIIKTFEKISRIVKEELNDEPFSPKLLSCVKCHLWRKIKYESKIPIKDKQIENSLKK